MGRPGIWVHEDLDHRGHAEQRERGETRDEAEHEENREEVLGVGREMRPSSGDSSGTLYSSANSAIAVSLTVSQPSTFVRPDMKKMPAIAKRAASASSAVADQALERIHDAVPGAAHAGKAVHGAAVRYGVHRQGSSGE